MSPYTRLAAAALAGLLCLSNDSSLSADVCELPKLVPADGAANDDFGNSAAMDGLTIVAGSPEDDDAGSASGSAYVFAFSGGAWSQQQKLTAPDAASGDRFGFAVSVSGPVIAVGSPRDDDVQSNSGSVYVFRFNGSTWAFEQKLTAPDPGADDRFGSAVAISSNRILVGSPMDDDVASNCGSAYFFEHDGSQWAFAAKFAPTDLDDTAQFGRSVAIKDSVAIVGAWQAEPPGMFLVGSAYVFRRGAAWAQEQKLTASDAADFRWFGFGVDIDGDAAAVGAWGDRGDDLSESGGVYFYRFNGSTWSQEANPNADPPLANDRFGWSVALDGDLALVGTGQSGVNRAYLLERTGGTWTQSMLIATSDSSNVTGGYGQAVDLQDGRAIVADLDSGGPGAVYAFELAGTDCNANGLCDTYDIASGASRDCDANSIPDECEPPLDISTFVNVLLGIDNDPIHLCLANLNGDTSADGRDIAPYISALLNP